MRGCAARSNPFRGAGERPPDTDAALARRCLRARQPDHRRLGLRLRRRLLGSHPAERVRRPRGRQDGQPRRRPRASPTSSTPRTSSPRRTPATFKAWAAQPPRHALRAGPELRRARRLQQRPEAIRVALDGRRYKASLPDNVTVAAAPIFGSGKVPVRGAVIVRAEPPPALTHAFDELRGDRLRALHDRDRDRGPGRLPGLLADRDPDQAPGAARPSRWPPATSMRRCRAGGGDEIGDLTRSLDTMREELRKTFDMLATERDRLSAIFDGLTEAVIVVGEDGEVRFTNPAAEPPGPRRQARAGADPRRCGARPSTAPTRSRCSRSTGGSTACRRGGSPPSTPSCWWSAIAPRSSSASRPSASSSPTRPTSCATRSPGS